MDQNQITESDILAGYKVLSLETRTGSLITVVAHALPWRKVIQFASESDLPKRNLQTIEAGVAPSHIDDGSLDSLTPDSIGIILSAISLLTNGLPTLKKNQALLTKLQDQTRQSIERTAAVSETSRSVSPLTPTSTPPNANSSSPAIPPPIVDTIPRSKYYKYSEALDDVEPRATSDSSSSPSAPVPT